MDITRLRPCGASDGADNAAAAPESRRTEHLSDRGQHAPYEEFEASMGGFAVRR